jgi:parallel beta-helix repeat protein
MTRKLVSITCLTIILIGILAISLRVQKTKASETIYIRGDGSVDPPTAPIHRDGNVYIFTDNIYEEIVVEQSNITMNGNGCTLQGPGDGCGFNLTHVSNVTIQNTNIKDFRYGVHLLWSSNNIISANNITSMNYGVQLDDSSNNVICGNNITNIENWGVLHYRSSNYNNVTGNNIKDSDTGVMIWRTSNHNIISGNTITTSDITLFTYSTGITIFDYSNYHNTIYGNTITNQSFAGVWLTGCSYNNVSTNTLTENSKGAWFTAYASNNILTGNNITNNEDTGVICANSFDNTISKNNITNNDYAGIWLFSSESQGNIIVGNNVSNNKRHGIFLQDGSRNNLTGNTVTHNDVGIRLKETSNNTMSGNLISENTFNFKVWGEEQSHFMHLIDDSNLVDGKPVYYLTEQSDLMITPSTYPQVGYLALIKCANITIEDFILADNGHGLLLAYTNASEITSNTIKNNEYGILLFTSVNNILRDNSMTNNSYNFGVFGGNLLEYINDIDTSNTVDSKPIYYWIDKQDMVIPADAGYVGLVNCTQITAQNLKLIENGQGILMVSTTDSTITGNNITDNDVGICLRETSNNSIYHNNFMNNRDEVLSENSVNIWDNGYPSGGNYWSSYSGTDIYKGPDQDDIGGDGIGDTPNTIDVDNVDRYPFMNPTYTSIFYFSLTISSTEGGTTDPVSGTYTYVNGTEVPFVAIPDAHFVFDHWELNGIGIGSENPVDVLMDENHNLFAVFADNTPPKIGIPMQEPSENVTAHQDVTVTVNVTDLGTGILNVTIWYSVTNGTNWISLNMSEISTNTYHAIILGQEICTWITYKIIAYDNYGNQAINDNQGYCYIYHVIPEFPSLIIIPLFMITTLLAVIVYRRRKRSL